MTIDIDTSLIKDTDLFAGTSVDGVTYKVNGTRFKDLFFGLPWEKHDGGIWHVIMDPGTSYFEVGGPSWLGGIKPAASNVFKVDGTLLAQDVDNIAGYGVDEVVFTSNKDSSNLFAQASGYTFGPLTNTKNVTSMESMFYYGDPNDDTDFNLLDMSNVTTISSMFSMAWGLKVLNASDWDLRNCKDMSYFGIEAQEIHMENWKIGTDVNMGGMMSGMQDPDTDLTKWDTSGVINMDYMFGAYTPYNGDLSMWCVSQFPTEPNSFKPKNWQSDDPRLPKWGQPC